MPVDVVILTMYFYDVLLCMSIVVYMFIKLCSRSLHIHNNIIVVFPVLYFES